MRTGAEVWPRLKVEERLQPGAPVLNIGVGLGHCTRDLAARGCEVHALDISATALQRVEDIATTWRADNIAALPKDKFIAVMSHLVAQHMTNTDLKAQIRGILPSLKADGVFAIQFAIPLEPHGAIDYEDAASAKGGSLQREAAVVEQMVVDVGGKVLKSELIMEFPEHKAGWHLIHIGR